MSTGELEQRIIRMSRKLAENGIEEDIHTVQFRVAISGTLLRYHSLLLESKRRAEETFTRKIVQMFHECRPRYSGDTQKATHKYNADRHGLHLRLLLGKQSESEQFYFLWSRFPSTIVLKTN